MKGKMSLLSKKKQSRRLRKRNWRSRSCRRSQALEIYKAVAEVREREREVRAMPTLSNKKLKLASFDIRIFKTRVVGVVETLSV